MQRECNEWLRPWAGPGDIWLSKYAEDVVEPDSGPWSVDAPSGCACSIVLTARQCLSGDLGLLCLGTHPVGVLGEEPALADELVEPAIETPDILCMVAVEALERLGR